MNEHCGCSYGFHHTGKESIPFLNDVGCRYPALKEKYDALVAKRFPLQGGPSVPWKAVLPHDRQCQKNHGGQTLQRIAERGGLDCGEFWYVMNDLPWDWNWKAEQAEEKGKALANEINEKHSAALEAIQRLREGVEHIIKFNHHSKLCGCTLCGILKETEQWRK